MKNLILFFLFSLLAGCTPNEHPPKEVISVPIGTYMSIGVYPVEIEGCEYFIALDRMTHKGNCKNKIHCYNE